VKLEYSKALRAKGWTAGAVAARWGMTKKGVDRIAAHPKQRDWDALNGLPVRNESGNGGD